MRQNKPSLKPTAFLRKHQHLPVSLMAASVNNMAATFATVSSSSSSSSPSSYIPLKQTGVSICVSHKPISTSWNPHASLRQSHKSTLLGLYGPPGPPPFQAISATRCRLPISKQRLPSSIPIGGKLPSATLSYLDRNGKLQTVALSSLCKGKKLVLVGVSAAFSPSCGRFVKGIVAERAKGADLIACVAVNDVFVLRAWGQTLGLGEKVAMLSDGRCELSESLGVSLDMARLGLGVRSRRFCLSAWDGVITNFCLDEREVEGVGDLIVAKTDCA